MILQESDFASNIARFTGFAELYDKYRPTPPSVLPDLLTQIAGIMTPDLVVDLGCGTGLSSRFWSSRARKVIGIEPTDDMRHQAQALTTADNVFYSSGFSHCTGLPDNCADIVTCSQSLHWMDPLPTFNEVARILRSEGVFAAYDYDFPPTTSNWKAEAAYNKFIDHLRVLEDHYNTSDGLMWWSKVEHLERMESSGCFKFVKEVVLHHVEQGNAERLIGLTQSQGNVAALFKKGLSERDLKMDELKRVANEALGESSRPWFFSARLRLGVV